MVSCIICKFLVLKIFKFDQTLVQNWCQGDDAFSDDHNGGGLCVMVVDVAMVRRVAAATNKEGVIVSLIPDYGSAGNVGDPISYCVLVIAPARRLIVIALNIVLLLDDSHGGIIYAGVAPWAWL